MPLPSVTDARAPLTLALDAGTSSVRALAFDCEGIAIPDSEVQISYQIETTPDGGATYPAAQLFELMLSVIDGIVERLGRRATEVTTIGTTSFWHSLLGLDTAHQPVTPIFYWADTRSAPDALALRAELDATAVWQQTGCRLHPSYWPAKLRWLKRTEPSTFQRVARWVSFPEFALAQICGPNASAATVCMASGTGLLDVHSLEWDPSMLDACALTNESVSPLVDLGPPGRLRDEFRLRWPALTEADWFPALGDGACANIGSGAIGPACLALTVGTSAAMRIILPRPPGSDWVVPKGLWAYRLDRERAVLGGALSNGGNLLRWIWETTGTGPHDAASEAAAALPPDSTGLTLLPFLSGERSPGWYDDADGVITGLTLSTRPEHLIRAGWEALAYRLADVYEALAPLADTPHAIVASGGAILSMPALLQITADSLGHDLQALAPTDETTARGAALMAMAAAGTIPSLAATSAQTRGVATYAAGAGSHASYAEGRQRQSRLESVLVSAGEIV